MRTLHNQAPQAVTDDSNQDLLSAPQSDSERERQIRLVQLLHENSVPARQVKISTPGIRPR